MSSKQNLRILLLPAAQFREMQHILAAWLQIRSCMFCIWFSSNIYVLDALTTHCFRENVVKTVKIYTQQATPYTDTKEIVSTTVLYSNIVQISDMSQ